jgi:translation initiation factor 3 subunit D
MHIYVRTDTGKYVLLKDPNKPTMRIYNVPIDAFSGDEDDEDDDDDDEEGDEEEEGAAAP